MIFTPTQDAKDAWDDVSNWYKDHKHDIPNDADIDTTRDAVLRSQRTYNLSVAGIMPDEPYSTFMGVGARAMKQHDWSNALVWFDIALNKLNATASNLDDNETTSALIQLYDNIAFASFSTGDVTIALKMSKLVLELDPTNFRVADNVEWYEYTLEQNKRAENSSIDSNADVNISNANNADSPETSQLQWKEPQHNYSADNVLGHSDEIMEQYRELCQTSKQYVANPSQFSCRVTDRGDPRLVLSPARIESILVGSDVNISIFRNFISDEERNHLVSTARDELERSVAQTGAGYKPVDFRVAKVAWLQPNRTEIIMQVHRRIQAVTGLDLHSAEELQVCNYGIVSIRCTT